MVDAGEATPPLLVERGALARLHEEVRRAAPAHRYAIVTDAHVAALHAGRAAASFPDGSAAVLAVPAGETGKTRESWARLTDELLARGYGRDTTVVAIGGGMVGDLAGFVAATFMRGVPVVQVPTTLLAMVDASLGGKTGVNTPAGKNLVGAFHPPARVVADPDALATLPARELRAGLAEVVKHGVVADEPFFEWVEERAPGLLAEGGTADETAVALVERAAAIKLGVVARDFREGGVRKILNFGHTLGHAVERLSGYALLHGEAVAIGMALESRLAELLGAAECGTTERVCAALRRCGLPVERPAAMDPEEILAATRSDKKGRQGVVEYALPRRIGAMAGEASGWAVPVADGPVREVLA